MAEHDSPGREQDVPPEVAAELSAAGFDEAEEIGRGGFGVVFRCRQPSVGRLVAVKVLTCALNSENLDRFVREQRAMGKLSGHPHIVNVLEVGATRTGLPYIVMQYHPRDSLEARIRRDGPMEWGEVLSVGVKMAGALETAHRRGVLHRDVKPANILITDYGEPQLTDFGVAHMAGAYETIVGTVSGSPAYIAPEALSGASPSPLSDIYSLGATLYCAVTGHAPFERRSGEQVVAQLLRITTQPIPDLQGLDLPDDVSAAVHRAMSHDPEDRFVSAAEFGDQLRAIEARHNRRIDDMVMPDGATSQHTRDERPLKGAGEVPTELSKLPSTSTATSTSTPSPGTVPGHAAEQRNSTPQGTNARTGNLPLEMTSFVGRRRERAEVRKMMSASRLVTLTGIGGVGKTRLALRVATDSRRAFPDGAWLIELGEVRDTMLVTSTVSAALGLRHQSADPALTVLSDHLAGRRLLLVLDNCEHLVDAVATLTEALLRTCPGLQILATSREPLGVDGETAMRVPPMPVPDPQSSSLRGLPRYESAALFVTRAVTAVPEFELTEDNQGAVAQICQRLDGLPLPIELAAVRLRAMSAQQIRDRLTDQYRLLTIGSRGAPSRQQTLRLCVDWSHELCTRQEQQVWARAAVFAGSFELNAAEAVCAGDIPSADLLDLVASLVDKSILIREESGAVVRYRLLETLRDYGREKLKESGEDEISRRRHRDWYEQLALQAGEEWISPRQLEWIICLEREQPNLRAALKFCVTEPNEAEAGLRIAVALFPFWISRGLFGEGRLWFDRVLAIHSGQPTADRATAFYMASVFAGIQGEISVGTGLLAQGDEITCRIGNASISAVAAFAAGCIALYSAEPARAIDCLKDAVARAQEINYVLCHISSLLALGLACMLQDNAAEAIICHQKMVAVSERQGEVVYRGRSSPAGGWAIWREGDPERATAVLEQGMRLSRRVNDPVGFAWCLQTLAWIAAEQHHEDRAAVLLGAAEGIWRDTVGPTASLLDRLVYQTECQWRTRRALGERKLAERIQYGVSLSLDDAEAYALGTQPHATPTQSGEASTALTRRERQVADLVAEGLTNKAIATRLVISQRTAQGHVEHILVKLGFTSRTQIAAWIVDQEQHSKS